MLHQFVADLPLSVSKQLHAAGAVTYLTKAITRAKLLMSMEVGSASTHSAQWPDTCPIEQVVTLAAQKSPATAGVWIPSTMQRVVDTSPDTAKARVKTTGCLPRAAGIPPKRKQITIAAVRSKIITICGQIGGSTQEVLLDSGSPLYRFSGRMFFKQAMGIAKLVTAEVVRLSDDYCELNKWTIKDAYPLPDKVQDRLAGAAIANWATGRNTHGDFLPGPGMGAYKFTQMSFGLCGAPH